MERKDIFACLGCESEFKLEELEDPHHSLNFCPKCKKEKNETKILLPLKEFQKEKRRQELAKRIYCRKCGHIGLVEEFPFDGPSGDDFRERRCPKCGSDNGVNLSIVKMCGKCGEVPAQPEDSWCKHCADEYDAACRAAECWDGDG